MKSESIPAWLDERNPNNAEETPQFIGGNVPTDAFADWMCRSVTVPVFEQKVKTEFGLNPSEVLANVRCFLKEAHNDIFNFLKYLNQLNKISKLIKSTSWKSAD